MIKMTHKSAIALAVTTALWGSLAIADNNDTATATVTGEVIASLEIANTNDMIIPTVVRPDAGEDTTVGITCDNAGVTTVLYDALGGNPYADGDLAATGVAVGSKNNTESEGNHTGTCAKFAVTGQADYHYNLVGTTVITTAALGGGLTLSGLNCMALSGSATDGTLSGTGTSDVFCGATVTVDEAATTGAYTNVGLITVGVVYD